MISEKYQFRFFAFILCKGAQLGCAFAAYGQAPTKTKLKRVLVLDKSQFGAGGHTESRRDFNAALVSLGFEKGFTITTISQTVIGAGFSIHFQV